MYTYLTLDPRPVSLETMKTALGTPTLGIEVTVLALAALCSQGNIDPQHTDGNADSAAIDLALAYPLPDAGTRLATVRADLDSVGAMAVFANRAAGHAVDAARVAKISAHDRFASGPWSGQPIEEDAIDWEIRGLAALVSDFKRPLDERVALMAEWLAGNAPADLASAVASARAEWRKALAESTVVAKDGIAVVTSPHRFAMEIGYAHAPVVIASNPAMRIAGGDPHLKHTVAQWPGAGKLDMAATLTELQARESGWSGNVAGGIIGSPQGVASALTTEDVVAVVQQHLI